ncbi:MAG: hypothetical protein IH796_04450 [Deltaproteobacteria bacterium]|nr:hypothetical protein [Deltaproteobacteria bacterium]
MRSDFGCLAEAYVHGVLATAFGDRYSPLDASMRGAKGLGELADGVIWYPEGFIVVECKAVRVKEADRYIPRTDDAYFKELSERGKLAKAVNQIDATIEAVRREQRIIVSHFSETHFQTVTS